MISQIVGFLVVMALAICVPAALAVKLDLPPVRDLKSMGYEALLDYVSHQPGMEYLNEQQNISGLNGGSVRLHPDILEDSVLLTVSAESG